MFRPVEKPRVAVLGLSLGLYREAVPGYMERLEQQLGRFVAAITPYAAASATRLCCLAEHVAQSVSQAERDGVDAILLVPVSYTASGMSVPCLLETTLPIVVWNTQEASTIKEDYSFDDLLMNHVAQGTQDVTSVLLRNQRSFGMVSGHFADPAALGRLADWWLPHEPGNGHRRSAWACWATRSTT